MITKYLIARKRNQRIFLTRYNLFSARFLHHLHTTKLVQGRITKIRNLLPVPPDSKTFGKSCSCDNPLMTTKNRRYFFFSERQFLFNYVRKTLLMQTFQLRSRPAFSISVNIHDAHSKQLIMHVSPVPTSPSSPLSQQIVTFYPESISTLQLQHYHTNAP